jgi:hypothetical protein
VTLPDFAWLNSVPLIGDKLYAAGTVCWIWAARRLWPKFALYRHHHHLVCRSGGAYRQAAGLLRTDAAVQRPAVLAGEQVAYGFRHATRLAAKRGDAAVLLAGQAVRAVALGVVVTALVQAVLGGLVCD